MRLGSRTRPVEVITTNGGGRRRVDQAAVRNREITPGRLGVHDVASARTAAVAALRRGRGSGRRPGRVPGDPCHRAHVVPGPSGGRRSGRARGDPVHGRHRRPPRYDIHRLPARRDPRRPARPRHRSSRFGVALFDRAVFTTRAVFDDVTFTGEAWFAHATFSAAASPTATTCAHAGPPTPPSPPTTLPRDPGAGLHQKPQPPLPRHHPGARRGQPARRHPTALRPAPAHPPRQPARQGRRATDRTDGRMPGCH